MHMNEVLCAGRLVQRVDVLGDGQHVAVMLMLELGKGEMGCVGARLFMPAAAKIVELMHADRIAREGFRRRNVLNSEIRPEPALPTEGPKPALGGQPSAGQDDDVVVARHGERH